MYEVYLIYQSVTKGQRAQAVLQRANLRSDLRRSPAAISPSGCAYALRIRSQDLPRAVRALREGNAVPQAGYIRRRDGDYERIAL